MNRPFSVGIFFALLLLSSLAKAASPAQESRHLFTNSVGPLPPQAEATVRQLRTQNLAETLEFELPLRMRNFPKLLERVGRGETVPRKELEKDYLPLEKDYEAVRRWLGAEGFTITGLDPSRLAIFASGTMAQIQQSLQVEMVKVTVKGTDYNTARTHPSLPAAIAAPVLGVNGLQPFRQAHKHMVQPAPAINNQPPYLVKEVLGAYNASNLGVTGNGEKIAILIDSVPRNSDLTSFWSSNNIAQSLTNIEKVNVNGTLPADPDGEATLDVEWSSSVAPGAMVRIYATGDLSFTDIDKALQRIISDLPNQPQLHELSISLGLGETYLAGSSEIQTESQYFATIASNNVSIFVASGDAGSNPDDTGHNTSSNPGPLQVEYESSDPSVTGVGGTNLVLDLNGKVTSETGWAGSGGGVSQFFSRPSWQTGSGVPAGTKRFVPDVSLVASDTTYAFFYFQGKQGGVAGTSWATPTWAGLAALINQARANNSLGPLGLLNPRIYPLIGTSNFRDIVSGSNGAYTAGAGYDRVTGIGVPNTAVLMATLAGTAAVAPSISSFNPSSGAPGASVVITGVNLSRASAVKFNGTSASSFTANSSTQVTAVVPTGATSGPISIVTPTATAVSTNSFTVLPPTVANDNFAHAQVISGSSGSVSGSNVGATKEAGEPSHAGNAGGTSVWYSWVAPQSGIYTFDTGGSSFDTLLAIYTGGSVASLSPVASNDDAGTGVTSAVSFSATSGTTYAIAVDGHDGQAGTLNLNWVLNTAAPTINNFVPASGAPGTVVAINGANFTGATDVQFAGVAANFSVLSATQLTATVPVGATTGVVTVTTSAGTATSGGIFTVNTPPPNDNFASATSISGPSGNLTGTNVAATKEPGEPDHAGNPGGHSVWYTWVAPASGNVTFNTFGSSFDTILAAYTGDALNALTEVTSNDDAGAGFTSAISFAATQGTAYHIALDGAGGVTGNLVLNWASNIAAPTINSFTPLSGGPGATVTLSGLSFSSVTEVDFNGVPASFVINSDTQISAVVPGTAGTGPIVAKNISGTGTSVADFTVSAAPGNDNFASAATFAGTGAVIGTNVGATKESGEPNHAGNAGGASVWWNWTAPASGDYTVSTQGSSFDTLLAVYTGSAVSALTAVAANDDDPNGGSTSLLTLHALAGTVYRIAVDGLNGATGQIALSIIAANTSVLFSTGFESAEGYSTALPLAGQKGWTNSGTGTTGIVNGFFPGMGQQGYIGSHLPRNANPDTFVWQPINYTPKAGDKITFQVTLRIADSTNGFYDEFGWAVFDIAGNNLFTIFFDNNFLEVGYALDDGGDIHDTGYAIDNATLYTLQVTMDFGHNKWDASVNGTSIVTGQPITTANSPLDLGDIDAVWSVEGVRAGNNSMVFDNYSIRNTGELAPQVLLHPQPQTGTAGGNVFFSVVASGTQPMTYQWRKDLVNISGATNASLTLTNVQPEDAGSYDVVVTNAAGSATSDPAELTIVLPQAPNLAPFRPSGWSDRIVVTRTAGATTDDAVLSSTDSLFVDWAIINSGLQDAAAGFQTDLYVDGALKGTWQQATALPPNTFTSITGYAIGMLAAGSHTVEIVTDSLGQVAEFDEADNTYTKNIIVTNPPGYYSVNAVAAPSSAGTVTGGGTFQRGTSVTLIATAAAGFRFVDWTDEKGVASKSSSYTFTVADDRDLVANFASTSSSPTPVVTITVPTSAPTYATIRSTINLEGTASSGSGVNAVTWTNSRGGGGKAIGTTSWSAMDIPLQPGDNLLTATIHDLGGHVSSATVHVSSVAAANFSGSYAGLLTTESASPAYVGLGQFSVTGSGNFTGTLSFHGKRHPVHGQFAPDGGFSGALGNPKSPTLLFNLTLAPGSNPQIVGTASDGTASAAFVADRAGFNAKSHPWGSPGQYTVALQRNTQDLAAPSGDGIASLKIDAGGAITYSGRLADGAAFSGSAKISQAGIWPFYTSLYRSAGYAAGPVTVQNSGSPLLSGVADWFKPANAPGGRYPAAIQTRLSILGNRFQKPAGAAPAIRAGTRTATLTNGDLAAAISNSVTLVPPNHFSVGTPNTGSLGLTLDATTGLLHGTFVHPQTGLKTSIHAVMLQADDTAFGYFLGPSESGEFTLGSAP